MVEQGHVLFVADGAHHRRSGRGHRADQCFVGEREQVLDAAAAARDDDHIDVGVGVEPLQGRDDLGNRIRSLHGHLLDGELRGRPAPVGDLLHVVACGRVTSADQPDHGGQERQRALAFRGEQAFRGQRTAQPFEPGEEFADADGADLQCRQGE